MKGLLINPFEKYLEKKLIAVGIILTLIASFFAVAVNGRFDGVLDLHFVNKISWHQPFLDNLVVSLSLMFFLIPIGKYINSKTRVIDIFSAVIIARIPFYFALLFNSTYFMSDVSAQLIENSKPEAVLNLGGFTLALLSFFAFCSLFLLIWYMVLLYNGFRTATHAKGAKPIILFILSIILAEVLSKFLVYSLDY